MSIGKAIGFACGVLVGLIVVALILKWTKKGKSTKCEFDERQELVRGKAFKYGFFTLVIANIVYVAIDMLFDKKVMDTSTAVTVCILAGVLVHVGYCIWHEGYFALNENPKKVMIAFSMLALLNLAAFVMQMAHNNVIVNGMLTFGCINLLCGIMFLVIFGIAFLKWNHDRKEIE